MTFEICFKRSLGGVGAGGSSMGGLSEYDQILTVVEALGRIRDSLCSYYFCVGLKIIIKSKVFFLNMACLRT